MITIAHYALVKIQEVEGGDDAAQARWFSIGEVPPLAFDHDRILRMAMSRLKERIHFEPVGFELLPDVFTMPQLQNLYEAILEVHFDRRNFASKMLKLGILEDTGNLIGVGIGVGIGGIAYGQLGKFKKRLRRLPRLLAVRDAAEPRLRRRQ